MDCMYMTSFHLIRQRASPLRLLFTYSKAHRTPAGGDLSEL